MISGQFLRRVEIFPSKDLSTRTDLLEFQLTKALIYPEWESLLSTLPSEECSATFEHLYRYYMKSDESVVLPPISAITISFTNSTVFWLSLLNRTRFARKLKLITLGEDRWAEFAAALALTDLIHLQRMLYNGIV